MTPVNFLNGKPTAYAFIGRYHNYGTTRTSHAEGWISTHYFKDTVPNSQDFTKPWDKLENINTIVGGNSDRLVGPVAVGADDVQNALNNRGTIVVWGRANWVDVYQRDKEKNLNFCYSMNPSQTPSGDIVFQIAPFRTDCNTSAD